MSALTTAMLELMQADSTMTSLLTGGIYTGTTISRQNTPSAFDGNNELLPCMLITRESEAQSGPYATRTAMSSREYIRLFCYQRIGYEVIAMAMERAWQLLEDEKLMNGVYEIVWIDDLPEVQDQALGCSLGISRYQATRLRT
jgi:hypothetical protein